MLKQNELLKNVTEKYSWQLLLLIILPSYFFAVNLFAINIPNYDDYDQILHTIKSINDENQHSNYANVLLKKANEHYIVLTKLVSLIFVQFFGEIDFRKFILLNSISSTLLFFFVFRYVLSTRSSLFLFVVLLFWFTPLYRVTNWSIAITHIYVIFFSILSLWFANKNKIYGLVLSFVFAVLASFTGGSGFLVFLPLLGIIFFKHEKKTLLFSMPFIFGFLGLIISSHKTQAHKPNIFKYFFEEPLSVILYFLNLLGSCFKDFYGDVHIVGVLIGVIVLLSILCVFHLCKYRIQEKDYLSLSILTYFILTFLLISASRAYQGMELATSNRYQIYVAMFFIVLLDFIMKNIPMLSNRITILLGLCFSLFFIKRYKINYDLMTNERAVLMEGMTNYLENSSGSSLFHPRKGQAKEVLDYVVTNGYYSIPEKLILSYESQHNPNVYLPELVQSNNQLNVNLSVNGKSYKNGTILKLVKNKSYNFVGYAFDEASGAPFKEFYYKINNGLLQKIMMNRSSLDLAKKHKNYKLTRSKFRFSLEKKMVKQGVKKIQFIGVSNNNIVYKKTIKIKIN